MHRFSSFSLASLLLGCSTEITLSDLGSVSTNQGGAAGAPAQAKAGAGGHVPSPSSSGTSGQSGGHPPTGTQGSAGTAGEAGGAGGADDGEPGEAGAPASAGAGQAGGEQSSAGASGGQGEQAGSAGSSGAPLCCETHADCAGQEPAKPICVLGRCKEQPAPGTPHACWNLFDCPGISTPSGSTKGGCKGAVVCACGDASCDPAEDKMGVCLPGATKLPGKK